jgi:hypothetical protein
VLEMTTQRLDLLAVIGIAVCWGVVALAWLAGAIYYQSREPAERTRVSYLSPLLITTVIMVRVRFRLDTRMRSSAVSPSTPRSNSA